MKTFLITESKNELGLSSLTQLRSFCELRLGKFSVLEKYRYNYPKADFHYASIHSEFSQAFFERNPFVKEDIPQSFEEIFEKNYLPWDVIQLIENFLIEDIDLLKKSNLIRYYQNPNDKKNIIGKKKNIFIHKSANIHPGVILDSTDGPILIDEEAVISPFSYLMGPLYIGKKTKIDNAKISNSLIGNVCKIGGEVESSIIQDYSNKHHEGFLGHSFVGRWVNIGALATTSDLKNNYGFIRLKFKDQTIETNTIKFGSIIGDYVKIGIGTMLNTGSVIEFGSNIFEGVSNQYSPILSWGSYGEKSYKMELFLKDIEKMMKRRDITLENSDKKLIEKLYF